VGVGARFPLLADLAVVGLDLLEQLLRFLVGDQGAYRVGYVVLEDGDLEVVTFEVQLGVGRLGAAAEAALLDGLDFADAVLGVMDGLAFSNVNGEISFADPNDKRRAGIPAQNQ
jgi:hypothetical protein